jgi:hypothetical protein
MVYAKLRLGGLELAPNPLKTERGDVFTNDPEIFAANGYKPVTFCPYPEDGKYYESVWYETDEAIMQAWKEKEPPPATARDLLNIITGGA